jgi:hypothetical protein
LELSNTTASISRGTISPATVVTPVIFGAIERTRGCDAVRMARSNEPLAACSR